MSSAVDEVEHPPLPEGVFPLLIADEDLALRAFRSRVTARGAVVYPSDLPSSFGPEGEEIHRDPRYCPACVREAVRWSAEPVEPVGRASEAR